MGRLELFPKSWSLKTILILCVTVLALLVLTSVLSVNFLGRNPAGVLGEGAAEGETPKIAGGIADGIASLDGEDIRDPEIAAEYGVPGYVEFGLMDCPQELALGRGEEWGGTLLVHFVSYTPELTELQLYVYPYGVSPWGEVGKGGGLYAGTYYEGGLFHFIDLISYSPSGAIAIRAGETLTIEMTIRIPADFPKSIERVPLNLMGIWSDNPGVGLILDSPTRQVIVR